MRRTADCESDEDDDTDDEGRDEEEELAMVVDSDCERTGSARARDGAKGRRTIVPDPRAVAVGE